VSGDNRPFVTDLLDRVQATGYTIIGNVSGKGHHGVREAHFMFSEQESLVMIMTVVPEEKVEPILAGLRPLFDRHSGVMFVSDVTVSRREYFGKQATNS
jgi:nitrogen regulatory protein PII